MTTISQAELEARLWDAANSLRGPVDPGDFKAYVFPLLFFKWISDTWDWEHAQAIADFGDAVSYEEESDYGGEDYTGRGVKGRPHPVQIPILHQSPVP